MPGKKIIIVGAGASGIAAAVVAARAGAVVRVFEKGKLPARKLLASGNGRCNLTNAEVSPADYYSNREFVAAVLDGFGFQQAKTFFEELGVVVKTETDGRVFPLSGKAVSVAEPLLNAAKEAGVVISEESEVAAIKRRSEGFEAELSSGAKIASDIVILACGSCAYPQLGGGESGYNLARSLGHTVTAVTPSLVPLCVLEKGLKRLDGIRADVEIAAFSGSEVIARERGEVLFTDYGISGPCTLNLSRNVVQILGNGAVRCTLNFFPDWNEQEFSGFMRVRREKLGSRDIKSFLSGMIAPQIANLLIDMLGLDKKTPVSTLPDSDFSRITQNLAAWKFSVIGHRPWTEAMAACGGIAVDEVDPNSLQSRKCPGLFITGELLDVDGRTGGFNLHFAWACAAKAGAAAAGC